MVKMREDGKGLAHASKYYSDKRIAVVGMSVEYAGCPNKQVFWERLVEKKANSGPISGERLGTKYKDLHMMRERSKFSDTFCNDRYGTIGNDVDNEHDLLLRIAKSALEDARIRRGGEPLTTSFDRCGIVSGCLSFPMDNMQGQLLNLYQSHLERELPGIIGASTFKDKTRWSQRQGSLNIESDDKRTFLDPASFVAEELGLGSLHYCVDAACASALYVLRLAQDHLASGAADMMLCGATCYPEPFFVLSGFSTFQAMPIAGTPADVSMPLHKDSGGLTPGEGGAVMVLKRLEDAIRDNDHIYGILLGVGINNAGCGLPLKPHMPSELGCMRETYERIKVKPTDVQYVECHATGTPQGDRVEVDAIHECFQGKVPSIGSTKGNFGHTLVAAGFAGMAKVLLSMEHGQIPPTPGVTEETEFDPLVVKQTIPWPNTNGDKKRAGLSAFGFGGTNAHAVFEEYRPQDFQSMKWTERSVPVALTDVASGGNLRLGIVGMDCHFGTIRGLSAFEEAIYNGQHGARELPEKRWRFLGKDSEFKKLCGVEETPMGCFVESIDVDFKRLRTPLNPEDMLLPQQLIAVKTIDRALLDAKMKKGGRVAVLVGLGTDMELYRHRARVALRERLEEELGKHHELVEKLMDYVHDRGTSTSYTSYIGNLIATRVASQWGFTGPAFTVTEAENSVYRCMEIGQYYLSTREVDGVVVAGVDLCGSAEALFVKSRRMKLSKKDHPEAPFANQCDGYFIGEGCGAFVLKRLDDCLAHPEEKVYAAVDSLVSGTTVEESCKAALEDAYVRPEQIEYLEVSGIAESFITAASVNENCTAEAEIRDLAKVYGTSTKHRRFSVSTVRTTTGHVGYATGAAAIIKAALCLYNRYLPCVPHFDAPRNPEDWPESFYVSDQSHPWVKDEASHRRLAAISGIAESQSCFHVILADLPNQHEMKNRKSLDPESPKLIILVGDSLQELYDKLENLPNDNFAQLVRDTIAMKPNDIASKSLTLCLVVTKAKLEEEAAFARKGIPRALKLKKSAWTSPSGSYLAFKPLKSDRIAFMYGEARSPYVGLGRELFRIYPELHEIVQNRTTAMWGEVYDEQFNPRAKSALELEQKRKDFEKDQVQLFRSGVFHSMCFTELAEKFCGIKPKAAFGLSLGEVSMLFAFSEENTKLSDSLTSDLAKSKVWNDDLAKKFMAIRNRFDIPISEPIESHWQGYVVRATKGEIEAAIGNRDDVFMMIVNDSNTALIAGTISGCQDLLSKLKKNTVAIPTPQRFVAHNQLVHPSMPEIAKIHSSLQFPTRADVKFFTNIGHKELTKQAIQDLSAHVAEIYRYLADFPAIVNTVYNQGFDVFVELGANNHRSIAVDDILKDKPHVSTSMDKENEPAWNQIMKTLAVLISNQTPGITIGPLYHPDLALPPQKPNKLLREIVVNGRFDPVKPSDIPPHVRQALPPLTDETVKTFPFVGAKPGNPKPKPARPVKVEVEREPIPMANGIHHHAIANGLHAPDYQSLHKQLAQLGLSAHTINNLLQRFPPDQLENYIAIQQAINQQE